MSPPVFLKFAEFRQDLLILGVGLLVFRHRVVAGLSWFAARWNDCGPLPGLIGIGLIVPWSVMLLISDSERLERFWWMWPLQAVAIATAVTYLPLRLGASRKAVYVISGALVLVVAANPLLIEHVRAWVRVGWSGEDAPEVMLTDYVAAQILAQGKQQAHIGYEVQFEQFMATFNKTDGRYKVGAQLDLMLRYRHGIVNLNRCAEGLSPLDEFRIVETGPPERTGDIRRYRFEIPPKQPFSSDPEVRSI